MQVIVGMLELGRRPSRKRVPVADYAAASKVCRAYIDENGIGGREWNGGEILDDTGKQIAYVSYNGRVWKGDRNTNPQEEIVI